LLQNDARSASALEHRERDTRPFEPVVAIRLRLTATARERFLNDVDAFVESVAAETCIRGIVPDRFDQVARLNDVLAAQRERVHLQRDRQLIHRTFDRVTRLRRTIAAETAAGHHVRVNGVTVGLLVRTTIDRERAAERRAERFAAVIAVCAGIGHDSDLQRGERAVFFAPSLTCVVI